MLRWLLIAAIVLSPLRGVMAAPPHLYAVATAAVAGLSHCHNDSAHASMNLKSERPACLCKLGCRGEDCSRGCCTAHASPTVPTVIETIYLSPIVVSTVAETSSHVELLSSRRLRPPIAIVSLLRPRT